MAFSAAVKCRIASLLLHQPDGLAGHVHIVADVGLLVGGNGLVLLVEGDFVVQVLDQFAQRQHGVRLNLLGADVVGDLGAGICAQDAVLVHVLVEDLPGLFAGGDEDCISCAVTAWLSA